MHIPGKREASQRNSATRFFRAWQMKFRLDFRGGKTPMLTPLSKIMAQPHAQKVAMIAGNKRRISTWQKCCEQANAIARKHALIRLGIPV